MTRYQWGATESLSLEEFDLSFHRYRLHPRAAEQEMAQSLRQWGQLSPVTVCSMNGRLLLLDGFKRHAAAGQVKSMNTLWTRRLNADAATAKAAVYTLNCHSRPVQALEEAWIVHALVREDGLSQPTVAELLGRHKSWVCRRLALLEKLSEQAREDLRLGLLSPTAARQLTRLPEGNQLQALATARRESLTAQELREMIDLLLHCATKEKRQFVLDKPRQALQEQDGYVPRGWDPRMSPAGNRVNRQLARLLESLAIMQTWLRHSGRGVLQMKDRDPLAPGFARLLQETREVAELTDDFLKELHLP